MAALLPTSKVNSTLEAERLACWPPGPQRGGHRIRPPAPARGVETPVQLVGRDDDVCGDPERLSWAHFGESAGAEEVAGCMAGECR
jgi:hypothetical protein